MVEEIKSVLEQVADRHHTTVNAVREEISLALGQSQADPTLSIEEFITFAALSIALSREVPAVES